MQFADDLEEIEEYAIDLDETLQDLEMSIKSALKSSSVTKVKYIEDRLERAHRLLESYVAEIRTRKGLGEIYRQRADEYKKKINALIPDINKLNIQTGFSSNRHELIINNADKYQTEQLLHEGTKVQKEIILSLDRQIKDIEAAKLISIETIAELGRQEEILKTISEDSQGIKENLKFAYKQLRVIARNLAKDWIIRILCCLILLAVISAIIIVAVVPKNDTPFHGLANSASVYSINLYILLIPFILFL